MSSYVILPISPPLAQLIMPSATIKKFTDNLVKGYGPESKRYTISCNGLTLRVSPEGNKVWVFNYQFNGKFGKRLTIGNYPLISLADANNAVIEARKLLAAGLDPLIHKEVIKQQNAALLTVSQLVDRFLDEHVKRHLSERSQYDYDKELKAHVVPVWGSRPANSITRADAIRLLENMVTMGQHSASVRITANLSKMWTFALDRGIVEAMPFFRLPKVTSVTPKERALSEDEIYLFWHGVTKHCTKKTAAMLKLMLLLGRRGAEVTEAMWSEVDLKEGVWHMMPAKVRKAKLAKTKPIIIPLPPLVLGLFIEARAKQKLWDHVFPSRTDSTQHVTVSALSQGINKNLKVMGFKVPFTPHDLRRTASTHFARLGYSQEEIDRILGHKIQGISGTYNRHNYVSQRLKALTDWDTEIQRIISGPAPVASK